MDTLLQNLRFPFRSMRRQPAFVAIDLTTLALGIGTATAMFTVVPWAFHWFVADSSTRAIARAPSE